MEFQEQRPRTARPGTGQPATVTSQDRLLTAHTSSPFFEPSKAPPKQSPFSLQDVEAGSLSRTVSANPERSPTRGLEQPSQEMAPPPFLSRDEATAPRQAVAERPSAAHIYRSYITPSQHSQYEAAEVYRRPSDPTGERPSSTSHMATLEVIREAVEEDMTPPRTATGMPPPPHLASHLSEHWSSAPTEPTAAALLSSDPAEARPGTGRPSTTASTAPPESQEFAIPPRRELPFKRPESRHSGSDRASPRPGSSALTMPPLPKPKLIKQRSDVSTRPNSASPTKEALSSRPGTASPLKRTFNAFEDDSTRAQTAAGPHMSVSKQPSPTRPPPALRDVSLEITARKPSRMDELLYGRQPLAERSANTKVQRIGSLTDAPHEEESPPVSPAKATAATYAAGTQEGLGPYDPTINAYAAITSVERGSGVVALEEYATQSREDRQAALDEFMVANLENPAFTKLCEDVENCWRRMALGL